MAVIIGESGAERAIKAELAQLGIRLAALSDLQPVQCGIRERLSNGESAANDLWEHSLAVLKSRLAEEEERNLRRLADERAMLESTIRAAVATLDAASKRLVEAPSLRHSLLSPRAMFLSLTLCGRYLIAKRGLRISKTRLRARRDSVPPTLRDARAAHAAHARDKKAFTTGKLAWWRSVDECLTRIRVGGELAGAEAELEVIRHLAHLPDCYVIINDVRIAAADWTRYRKRSLLSAQIDHLVVGPPGVFIIETKNWSSSFLRSGDYFDPYEQVGRAAHLCYVLLKSAGLPPKNRSIIASKGALPPKPSDSYSKVLFPRELVGYITSFPQVLDGGTVQRISSAFR